MKIGRAHDLLERESDRAADHAMSASSAPSGYAGSFTRMALAATRNTGPVIQRKLAVGRTDDPLEHEADRITDHVIHAPVSASAVNIGATGANGFGRAAEAPRIRRKCAACEQEEQKLQRRATGAGAGSGFGSGSPGIGRPLDPSSGTGVACGGERADTEPGMVQRMPPGPRVSRLGSSLGGSVMTAPPIVHEVLSSPGRPLNPATRGFMEPRFGYDFGSVRLHTGETARRSVEAVGAHAYTVREHIVLREESASRELLAHELTHVVQQDAAPTPLVQREDETAGSGFPHGRAWILV
jgi:hypothetical protein